MDNPVVNFLREHQGVVFSRTTLKRRLNINTKRIINRFIKSAVSQGNIRRADPYEVGSYKYKKSLAIYTAC